MVSRAPLSRSVSCIVASGIPHHLLAATLPCLPGSSPLIPSSCLSKRWNVSHAPKRGHCPYGKIQPDCPGSPFLWVCISVNSIQHPMVLSLRHYPCSKDVLLSFSKVSASFMPPAAQVDGYHLASFLGRNLHLCLTMHRICVSISHKGRQWTAFC